MARRFRGESVHKVDGKGRVSIPAPFRRVLEDGDPDWKPGEKPNLVLVYGRKGRNCLEGYSVRSMEKVDDMISALPRFAPQREALERMLNSQSVDGQVDENGRLVLKPQLRERFGLFDEALFAGMGEKFQIWEPGAYAEDQARIEEWVEAQDEENDPFALLDTSHGRG
ncbi:MAG: division/cell wall cluster transcriptional repressor MraZ [Pseudomonadota bacterium]